MVRRSYRAPTEIYADLINELDSFMRRLEHEGYLKDDIPTRFAVWRNFQDLAISIDRIYADQIRSLQEDAEDEKRGSEREKEEAEERRDDLVDAIESIAYDIEEYAKTTRPTKTFILGIARRLRALVK